VIYGQALMGGRCLLMQSTAQRLDVPNFAFLAPLELW
jgi:hypothetical protein